MADSHLLFLTLASLFAAFYVADSLFRAWVAKEKLSKIPTIGPSGILSSYFGAYRFISHARDMIQEGYEKYPGGVFKVPTISRWTIVVSGPDKVEDIRKATDDQLSFKDAVADTLQVKYTLGHEVYASSYHTSVVRSPLTRNLASRFSDVQDEVAAAFMEHIPPTEGWSSVVALSTVMKIVCRTSNRLFVGLPLCRNFDYTTLNQEFTIDVIKGAQLINLFPKFLKPFIGHLFTRVPASIERALKHLGPMIQERLDKDEQYGPNWPNRPNDLISWLLEYAQGQQRSVRDLTIRVLTINFAAIHTTSMTFTQVLFNLATYPSYIPALREEVEAIVKEEGLTNASLHKMWKVDSFIKESQRCEGLGAAVMQRKVLKDFTFSDGTVIPEGNVVVVANFSTHHDESNYTEPEKFKGFRFAQMREHNAESFKHRMVSLDSNYIVFGNGRHACPGRFFAVNELKAFLAHVLLTYDVAFKDPSTLPQPRWFETRVLPDPSVSVMFRKRQS